MERLGARGGRRRRLGGRRLSRPADRRRGEEAGWIQARATAEGIKSECYRYAARAGGYAVADADAAKALAANAAAIAKQATDKGLVRADNPVPQSGGDKREPPAR